MLFRSKLYGYQNGLTYKYYQPANGDQATDDDRYDAMKAACDAGAKVVVCAGFMQGTALAQVAAEYPEVNFVFIDGWAFDGLTMEIIRNALDITYDARCEILDQIMLP